MMIMMILMMIMMILMMIMLLLMMIMMILMMIMMMIMMMITTMIGQVVHCWLIIMLYSLAHFVSLPLILGIQQIFVLNTACPLGPQHSTCSFAC